MTDTTSTDRRQGLRILVVDDDPDTACSFAQLLQVMGHDARFATDGVMALGLAQMFQPQAAMIDIHMPGLNGHEVSRRIRTIPGLELSLLVAVTGWGPGDKRRSPEGDFDVFLLKPVALTDLESVLRMID